MRKFMTIFVAVVLCISALAVVASAKNTNCTATADKTHDWSAWKTVKVLEDGTIVKERTCACGRVETEEVDPPHKHSIAYMPATEACHVPGCAEYWYCTDATCQLVFADEELTQVTNRKNLETPAVVELQHIEAVAACHDNGYLEHWYCPKCDNYFADAAATKQTNIKNLTVEGDLSKLEHHAAVAPTATENGMQEYWYCAGCDCYFTDAEGKYNIAYLSLTIPATGEVEHKCTIAYMPATEACHVPGCAEYWYCTDATCQIVYADEACTQVTNRKNLETPAVVELQHIEAVAACHNNGYLEHWYCPKCDNYFADAAATQQTNIKNLTVEGDLSKLEYHAAVAATATENGMQEYWYCAGCDCYFTDAEGKYNIAYLSLTIPATGEPTNPDTGDNAIFFIVALVAVATLGVAAVSFKKREN